MKWEAKYFSSYDAWIIFEENGEVLTLENEEKVKLTAAAPEMKELLDGLIDYFLKEAPYSDKRDLFIENISKILTKME